MAEIVYSETAQSFYDRYRNLMLGAVEYFNKEEAWLLLSNLDFYGINTLFVQTHGEEFICKVDGITTEAYIGKEKMRNE